MGPRRTKPSRSHTVGARHQQQDKSEAVVSTGQQPQPPVHTHVSISYDQRHSARCAQDTVHKQHCLHPGVQNCVLPCPLTHHWQLLSNSRQPGAERQQRSPAPQQHCQYHTAPLTKLVAASACAPVSIPYPWLPPRHHSSTGRGTAASAPANCCCRHHH